MRTRVLSIILAVALGAVGLVLALPSVRGTHNSGGGDAGASTTKTCADSAAGDFNGDGVDEIAVGIPDEDVRVDGNNISNAGAVEVFDVNTATTTAVQLFTQRNQDLGETPESGDNFGACVAAGDFNSDGDDDLVVGAPGEGRSGRSRAGAIHVIYGSADGLDPFADIEAVVLDQNSTAMPGFSEVGDEFGSALIAAEFTGDDVHDLAIGAPLEAVGSREDSGSVWILKGDMDDGLTPAGAQLWHQDATGVQGSSESNDRFGQALAAGDIDGDDHADLVIGVPLEDITTSERVENAAGAINVLYGIEAGLTASGDDLIYQNVSRIRGRSGANDRFGEAVASGDFDGDDHDDVVVGVPGEDAAEDSDGWIQVIYGANDGLTTSGNESIDQVDAGRVATEVKDNDGFGSVLNAADFDDDNFDDVAVGVPHSDSDDGSVKDVGRVFFIAGNTGGLNVGANPNDDYTENEIVSGETAVASDLFGASLVSGDFETGGLDDLAIGVPNEEVGAIQNAGAVDISFDFVGHAASPGNFQVSQDSTNVPDSAEANDHFGAALG